LYDVEKPCHVPDLEILNFCKELEMRLSDNDKKYINGYDLHEEILIFCHLIDKNSTPFQVLSEIKKNEHISQLEYCISNYVNNFFYVSWSRKN
jgi:hypothetical protein